MLRCFRDSLHSIQKAKRAPARVIKSKVLHTLPSDINLGKGRNFRVGKNSSERQQRLLQSVRLLLAPPMLPNATDPNGITIFFEPIRDVIEFRLSRIDNCNSHFAIYLRILLRRINNAKEFFVWVHALDSVDWHGDLVFEHITVGDKIDHLRNVH